jgi:hypothetical protein
MNLKKVYILLLILGYIKGAYLIAETGAFTTWVGNLIDPKK